MAPRRSAPVELGVSSYSPSGRGITGITCVQPHRSVRTALVTQDSLSLFVPRPKGLL
jgi:hypothetical protein